MAGWIKMRKDLDEDPKTIAIARRLKLSIDTVLGKLFRLWKWADTHAESETVPYLDGRWVDDYVAQAGFAESLIVVGWISVTPTGLTFCKFARHNWQEAKDKVLAAERQDRHRKGKSRSSNGVTVTKPSPTSPTPTPNSPLAPQRGEAPSPETGASAPPPPADVVLTYPCLPGKKDGPREWHLTGPKLAEYRESYPGLDVLAEARKARQWCIDNPALRKTHAGMPAYLTRWFNKAQNSGRGAMAGQPMKQETIQERLERIRRQQGGAKDDMG